MFYAQSKTLQRVPVLPTALALSLLSSAPLNAQSTEGRVAHVVSTWGLDSIALKTLLHKRKGIIAQRSACCSDERRN